MSGTGTSALTNARAALALVPAACVLGLWLSLSVPVGAASGPSPATAAADSDSESWAWALLAKARDQLRGQSPLAAGFTQTFVPSGFAVGDTESGELYIDLPRCLRFEYREPFPKNFLLCGDWVYTWNPGEPSGRRYLTTEGDAEGLDLLRLEVEALRKRYRASHRAADGANQQLVLIPIDPNNEIRSATLELAPESVRLQSLSYEDSSGNRTRFEINDYRALAEAAAFRPPQLEWLQD